MPTSFSYSDYSSLVQCYRKYKLIKIDKVQILQSGEMAFGSALHAGIHAALESEDPEAVFDLYWQSEKDKNLTYGRHKWDELQKMGERFVGRFGRLHAKKFVAQKMEERLYSTYAGVSVEGTPDFIGTFEGDATVFDWKTSAYAYPKEKKDIALQLYLYAFLAIQNIPGFMPKKLGYLVFNKGVESIQTLVWDFDINKMHDLLTGMTNYCKKIDGEKDFPKNPNACIMGSIKCSFYDRCWNAKK